MLLNAQMPLTIKVEIFKPQETNPLPVCRLLVFSEILTLLRPVDINRLREISIAI